MTQIRRTGVECKESSIASDVHYSLTTDETVVYEGNYLVVKCRSNEETPMLLCKGDGSFALGNLTQCK